MKKLKVQILLFLGFCLLTACNEKTVYSEYESIAVEGWARNDTIAFNDIVIKATTDYKEEIGVRINDAFPFLGLFLYVEQEIRPGHIIRTDTLSCRLMDEEGNVKGRGLSFYQYNFHLTTLHLYAGDTLSIRIRHNMRRETLPGVANIGMRISKQ